MDSLWEILGGGFAFICILIGAIFLDLLDYHHCMRYFRKVFGTILKKYFMKNFQLLY
jgi:hypothetical protein